MDFNESSTHRKPKFWHEMTKNEKNFFILLLIAFILIFVLFFLFITTKTDDKSNQRSIYINNNIKECGQNHEKICLSPDCVKAAARILSAVDFSVSPCDNFYEFACGSYLKRTPIPDDKASVSTFSTITEVLGQQLKIALEEPSPPEETSSIKKLKKFYQSCMNEKSNMKKGLKEASIIMEHLGGWPVLEGRKWNEDKFNWMKAILNSKKLGVQSDYLFKFGIGANIKDTSRRILEIDQPSLGLDRSLFLSENKNMTDAYYTYMVEVAVAFGADPELAKSEFVLSFNLERALATISLAAEDRRDLSKLFNIYTVAQLNKKFSFVDWYYFLKEIMPENVEITSQEKVDVINPDYIKHLDKILKITPKRVLANYVIWRVVKSLVPYLSELSKIQMKYVEVISGQSQRPARWKECVAEVSSSLPILTGSLYVRKYVSEDTKTKALELVKYLKHQYHEMLGNIDWMDEQTKKETVSKSLSITEHIGYPDELLDDNKLEQLFKTLEIDENDYLKSSLLINLHWTEFEFSRLHKPVSKKDWINHGASAQVNAFYNPTENSISGILQGQFFNKGLPNYINFGSIGTVIGHEISHAFDDIGKQFDKNGNLVNWWSKNTSKLFKEKSQCFIDQYGNYTIQSINQKLNGKNTLGENIADNGGLKAAYLAYKSSIQNHEKEATLPGLDFTPDQLFWISSAMTWCSVQRPENMRVKISIDKHAPEEVRVLGPLKNSEYFSKDFSCPLGSNMNPKQKCTIW